MRQEVEHALRHALELAGQAVEGLEGCPFGDDPYAQRIVVACKLRLVARQGVSGAVVGEVLLVKGVLQLGIALVDALDGLVDLVDDRAGAFRRREEERSPGKRGNHVESFYGADVDAKEGVGLFRYCPLCQFVVGGAFYSGVLKVVFLAEIGELFAAQLRGARKSNVQRPLGEEVGRRYFGVLVGDEQRGVRSAVAVPGILVHVVECRAVRHTALEVDSAVLEHVYQVDCLVVGGFALGFHELVRPSGELCDTLQVIVGVAFERTVGIAAEHTRDVHVPHPDHALLETG